MEEDCEIRLGGALRRKFDVVGKWALLRRRRRTSLELFDVAAMTDNALLWAWIELIGFALWGVATAIPLISSLNAVD